MSSPDKTKNVSGAMQYSIDANKTGQQFNEWLNPIILGIAARSDDLHLLERAIVNSAYDELIYYVLNFDFHWAEFNGELDTVPMKYQNESLEDYIFRRVTIHWNIISSYWTIAVERNGAMSDECVAILNEIKELADFGLGIARNLSRYNAVEILRKGFKKSWGKKR